MLYWIPDAVDPDPLKVFVTVLGLAILVPYAMGIFGACGCAKDRQEKGIARIQELTSIAKYYRACRRYELEESAGYFGPSETNERKWHFGKNVSTAVQYIFQNAKDGDELYFFDKTSSHEVAACKRSQSVVVYRKDEDIVVGGGLLNSRDF